MALRVALGNNKGGTGKTSSTINLAAALAEHGKRVLVVGMDPQMNAERRMGVHVDEDNPIPTVSEAIKDGRAGVAIDAITDIKWPAPYNERIRVIPARYDLENRISEAAVLGAVSRLRTVLDGVDDDYDFTLIDCPPSLGHLTQMALCAADVAVVTLEPEYDAVASAVRFRDFIETQAAELKNPELAIIGYIVNRVRSNLGAHTFQLEGLAERFGADKVWEPYIAERTAIKDAADSETPLRLLGSGAPKDIAHDYRRLAGYLIKAAA
ncbi:ParA family protein [[Kitasatospora] papulosa]|uniref:ParA family protein n=1 Tax=[Kitasatospora] papulosa TaxID=1464011 RepID=UPI0038579432